MSGCDQSAATLERRRGGIIVAQESDPWPGTLLGDGTANDLLVGRQRVATTLSDGG